MAQCKWCKKKGFFRSVDSNGLCTSCAPGILFDIQQRFRIVNDCMRLAQDGKTFKTRYSRCNLLLEHAEQLLKYEKQGIGTISPSPSAILKEFGTIKENIVSDELRSILNNAKSKAEVASTVRSKQSALSKGILKARELPVDEFDVSEIEKELNNEILHVKLNGFEEAARKAEFKGNTKKAIEQYEEALFLLKETENPKKYSKTMNEIQKKLDNLKQGAE